MKYIEPDFDDFVEAVIEIETYHGDPDEFIVYEQNKKGAYYPSFIRYSERVLDVGAKASIEVASNGYIIKSKGKTEICENKWELEGIIHLATMKFVEKERDLTDDETEELMTLTLKVNTHFAAQSNR